MKNWTMLSYYFLLFFYISHESPDFCVHFAKKIRANGAELPKLCLYQVSGRSAFLGGAWERARQQMFFKVM